MLKELNPFPLFPATVDVVKDTLYDVVYILPSGSMYH